MSEFSTGPDRKKIRERVILRRLHDTYRHGQPTEARAEALTSR